MSLIQEQPPTLDRLIFGGSFDPPHKGHEALIRFVLDRNLTDNLDIIPASISPFKISHPPAPSVNRLRMIELMLEHIGKSNSFSNRIHLLDIELKRSPPSRTFDTCCILRKEYPQSKIGLLIGADSMIHLKAWYRSSKILKYHPILVFPRKGIGSQEMNEALLDVSRLEPASKIIILDCNYYHCSSSEIRDMIRKSKGLKKKFYSKDYFHFLCPDIIEYIYNQNLYQNVLPEISP